MQKELLYLCAAIAGYLLGNVQCAVILSRLKYHDDVRNHGSGNAGSTNMLRVFGLKPGLVTFVGDFLKGVLGVLIGRWIAGETGGYISALFTVLGHDFPAFLGFKGGKGVAASFGIVWVLNPLYGAIITAVAVIAMWAFKTVSIVSLIGVTTYLVLTLCFSWDNTQMVVLIVILWALIVIRHAENIRRICKGEEGKLFGNKKAESEKQEPQG